MPNAQSVRRLVMEARALVGRAISVTPGLAKLMTHPRNRRINFRRTTTHKNAAGRSVAHKSFLVDRNLCYDGITKPMKQVFWTSFAAPSVNSAKRPPTANGCHAGGRGKDHGTRVHKDVERLTRAIYAKLDKKNGTPTVAGVDPCAYWIVCALVKRGIVPRVSEFSIFDECTGLATAIDILAWDIAAGTSVAVEVKTGHNNQTNYSSVRGNAHFRPPMEIVPDSALNRAATQLLMSVLIIARRYDVQIDRAIILRPLSGKNEVQLYEMPPWALNHTMQQNMYSQLRSYTTSGANARRVMKRTCFGPKQRVSLEQQEARQIICEMQADPRSDVFWTPTVIAAPPPPRRTTSVAPDRRATDTVMEKLARIAAPHPPSSVRQNPRAARIMTEIDLTWRAEIAIPAFSAPPMPAKKGLVRK